MKITPACARDFICSIQDPGRNIRKPTLGSIESKISELGPSQTLETRNGNEIYCDDDTGRAGGNA